MVGRFNVVDRFAEKIQDQSPYQYGLNQPINNIDFNGDSVIRGAGFVRNVGQGFADGFKEPKSLLSSLTTGQGWLKLGYSLSSLNPHNPLNSNTSLAGNLVGAVASIPNMTGDDWGHAVGYGTEKIGEAALISRGAGSLSKAFSATASTTDISTLYHATSNSSATASILGEGINSAAFNSTSRFGAGFYMSNNIGTSVAELAHHGATAANVIQFSSRGGSFLNATSPVMGFGVRFAPNVVSSAARGLGYDGIMYNSLRGSGVNVVQYKNFNLLGGGKLIK